MLMFCSAFHSLSWSPSDLLPFFLLAWTLDLWCEKPQHPGVRQEGESQCDGTGCLANTHCGAAACGGLYGPSDVKNRATGPPVTTALCIRTHPQRGALPEMATCPIHTHKHYCTCELYAHNRCSFSALLHTHTNTHTALVQPWSQCEWYMGPLWRCFIMQCMRTAHSHSKPRYLNHIYCTHT